MNRQNGIILVHKPEGCTSARVVAELKRRLKLNKIGHAGTLDPMATGLLVCLCGQATRLAAYAESGRKVYSGEILFGCETATDDVTGEVVQRTGNVPDFKSVEAAVQDFTGTFDQVPPAFSALKVQGQRAYALARQGKDPELKPRTCTVYSFKVFPGKEASRVGFRVECEKGTYIRALARDLGRKLTCGATLFSLCREASAPFQLDEAKDLTLIANDDIVPWDRLFPGTNSVRVSQEDFKMLASGNIRVLQRVCGDADPETRFLIYRGAENQAGGLLKKAAQGWEIAATLSEVV